MHGRAFNRVLMWCCDGQFYGHLLATPMPSCSGKPKRVLGVSQEISTQGCEGRS